MFQMPGSKPKPPSRATNRSFTSAPQVITSGGALGIAHGLGGMPSIVQLRLRCVNAILGYSVGDEVVVGTSDASPAASRGVSVVPDAVNINLRYGSDASVYQIPNKGTGVYGGINNADWSLVIKALG